MLRKKNDSEIDKGKLNLLVVLSNHVLKILFVILIVVGTYLGIKLLKELGFFPFLFTILKLLTPLFIGLVVAWLLDPIVTKLHKKGLRRGLGAAICYIVFVAIIVLVLSSLIPILAEQVNDFVTNTVPSVFSTCETWIDDIFDKFNNIDGFDANTMKFELFAKLEKFATDLTSSLPSILVNSLKAIFSGLGTFVIGMIIGFYLLLDFDKNGKALYELLPGNIRKDAMALMKAINVPLKKFVQGSLIDCTVVFIVMLVGFALIGLKAPMLFALFCGITNIIPYVGPYIGGAPAVIVGLSQSTTIGIIVLIFIAVCQLLEGNLFQPLIMSKTTKLNPVVIILGLLIFGHFFGIVGMILATPIIGAVKSIIMFFDNKYHFLEVL